MDWLGGMLNVERGIVNQIVDDVKTETSRGPKTLDPELLVILKLWKAVSQFVSEEDWIFASASKLGRLPFSYTGFWPRTAACGPKSLESGISGRMRLGTHTYRSRLDAVGASIAVPQELMRHSDIGTTMNIYGNVVTDEMERMSSRVANLALKPIN